jgi:putative hemolysin
MRSGALMITDILLLLVLFLLNGVFAMSEIAVVSSRRARLVQLAETSAGARRALALASEPTRFLSSVQVGITFIGILSGAIGEASIAGRLRVVLERWPIIAPFAETLALGIMVVVLTYFSLILGELVPKRLALTHPERIASLIAPPMDLLARVGRPLVRLLSLSTDGILRLVGVRQAKQAGVTIEELRVMLKQGAAEGVFERTEHEMVSNVLDLNERHVGAVLTPRSEVVFLDIRDSVEVSRAKLREEAHSVLPVCDGGWDHALGFIRSTRLLDHVLAGEALDLHALVEPPLFVPETMTLMKLLEQFKRTHLPVALVVDEFGGVEGLVSLADVVGAIVGELPTEPGEEPSIVRRDDGSWLIDGSLDLDTVSRTLDVESLLTHEERQHYHTLGGLVMFVLGRVPRTGDVFDRANHRFEVVDMDGNRVDRVWISRTSAGPSTSS